MYILDLEHLRPELVVIAGGVEYRTGDGEVYDGMEARCRLTLLSSVVICYN